MNAFEENTKPASNDQAADKKATEAEASSELSSAGTALARHWKGTIAAVWGGQAISFVTSGAAGYALLWYLVETTGSAMILALATVMYFIPTFFLGPLAGTIVDRHNRKYIMMLADAAIAVMTIVMGISILAGLASVPLVLVMLAVRSIGTTFHQPAMGAAMPLLVPERHLVRIGTLDQGVMAISNIAAPALGILLYMTLGLQIALFLDAAGALVACGILALVVIPDIHQKKEEQNGVLLEMKAGILAIRERHGLTTLFILVALGTMAFMPMGSLFPLYTAQHFGGDGYAASITEAAFGIGFLLGSIALGIWGGGKKLVRVIVVAVFGCGLVTAACGLLPPSGFWWFVLLSGLMAVTGAFFNSPLVALIQKNIAPEKLGRVLAVFGSLTSLAAPVGLLIAGPIAETTSIAPVFVASGVGMLVVAIAVLLFPSVHSLDTPIKRD